MTRRLAFLRSPAGLAGAVLLTLVVALALVGPLVAPHAPDRPIGVPLTGPADGAPFGTDFLGRDVLSRTLWGGRSVLALAGLATILAYAGGLAVGLVAGYSRSLLDPILMRAADVLLSFPALLFLLVLVTGAGTSKTVLVLGVAIVQMPLVARIVRTATLEQSLRGFVEAAVARGERTSAVLRREILPNIVGPITADVGLRFTYAIILVASVNFLGLGLQPPDADWALIISENRSGLTLNPWVILLPAMLIALLTISVNLVGDALARSLGVSTARRRLVR
ncbi:MAG: ABC transporter permease [Thermoleophilia bacterium]|nr:ABC transporter permease [Thermoleophilia bacterium]